MQFCLVVTCSFLLHLSFTTVAVEKGLVLVSCHVTLQLHRGTGNALFKKNQGFGGRTQQINWEPVFLKADLCQWGAPHTV